MKTKVIGHRGCRGLLPENSIEGFLKAMTLGVNAIELDIVVTQDRQLLVAHDPWFEPLICEVPSGPNNFFELSLETIQQHTFGTVIHPNFPDQQKIAVKRPTLEKVVNSCFIANPELPEGFFVIEVKSQPDWYTIFQPGVDEYALLVANKIKALGIEELCMVQSFDHNFLNAFYAIEKGIPLGLLVEDVFPLSGHLSLLDFKPAFYNPEHVLVTKELLSKLHNQGIACYTWTVNTATDKEKLAAMGVDGIITDYP